MAMHNNDYDYQHFDSICSICDNGGSLLCCEGRCMRSFHATLGSDPSCESLGLSDAQMNNMQNFQCKNCEYNQHQCYACGKLGSSNELSGPEVFQCGIASCGRFYHPNCVAKLLSLENKTKEAEIREKVASGEIFTCPSHECFVCKLPEDEEEQFAICRRCPKSYHRTCLPREIAFEPNEAEGVLQRAFTGVLPNDKIPIFCLDHEMEEDLYTPLRNHIRFPDLGQ